MWHEGRAGVMLAAVVSMIALSGGNARGPLALANAQSTHALPATYQVVENYFKLPDGRKIGSTAAVAIDRDGRSIWVFERCGGASGGTPCAGSNLAPILEFESSGKLVKSFGAGMFVYPHGIHVDREGNIWVTDGQGKDAKGQQVFKLSPEGRVLMTLGKAGIAGDGPDTFNQPSHVFVAPDGDIFVADGHGGNSNARIVKFSKDGKFIKAWGKKGSGPGEFDTPHSLAMDSSGRLFVADRGNNRIQIFDQNGTFLAEWKQFGRPSGLYIDKHDTLYAADTQSDEKTNPGFARGIRIGSARDGKVTALVSDPDPDGTGEGIAADASGNLYGALTTRQTVKRYVPAATQSQAAQKHASAPRSLRLYIFDCGTIHTTSVDAYSLKNDEVRSTEMSIPCIMVAHPKGTLMWDNGDIPDRAFKPGGGPAVAGVVTQAAPLLPQLAAVGYAPADITYLAMSHYHGDHVANANAFAGSIWLVRKVERDRMFSDVPIPRSDPANYNLLKNSRTVIIDKDEYDVFGDGRVIIKSTPGHTPGHQVLFLKLAKTGPVVLSGDLYHYPEERTLNRLPVADFNKEQTAASRAELEVFLKKTGAQLWIQHDFVGNAKLKKAPAFYD